MAGQYKLSEAKKKDMIRGLFTTFCCLALFGCSEPSTPDITSSKTSSAINKQSSDIGNRQIATLSTSLIDQMVKESNRLLTETSNAAAKLQSSIDKLTTQPSKESLQEAHQQWSLAHDTYISTRLLRQWLKSLNIIHPVLDVTLSSPELVHTNHNRIDQYPLIPGYLDKVQGYPLSGLIHSEIELTEDSLNQEHLLGDSAYVALGFHALEFMLFGESGNPRVVADFSIENTSKSQNQSAKRRAKYLKLLSKLLKQDIEAFSVSWNRLDGYYPAALATIPEEELRASLRQIAEVELEACRQIQMLIGKQAMHDTKSSIAARISLANRVIETLESTRQN
jgi:uncharacterized iron-regulated protein